MNLACQKWLGEITKVLEFEPPLHPYWEKFPKNVVFFYKPPKALWEFCSTSRRSSEMPLFMTFCVDAVEHHRFVAASQRPTSITGLYYNFFSMEASLKLFWPLNMHFPTKRAVTFFRVSANLERQEGIGWGHCTTVPIPEFKRFFSFWCRP